jgi:EmrB/QacA subfamily drug resistance transporter
MEAIEAGGRARPGLILGICCISLGLTGLDTTIVNVALPSMGRDMGAQVSGLQWIVAGYTIALTSCLLSSGTLADRFGRRRVFLAGLSAFAAASWLCSLAPSLGWLIAFRVLQGCAASLLNPAALGIISSTFPRPAARARAIGVWDGVFGLSLALGPVVGGVLTGLFGWRSVFQVSIPIALAAIAMTGIFVPDSRAPRPRRADPVGQILVIVALASMAYAIIQAPQNGWTSPVTVSLAAVAVAAAAVLVQYESQRTEPLIDSRDFRRPPFAAAVVTAVVFTAALAGFLFLTTLYLQDVRGYSPLRAGLAILPMPAVMAVCAPFAGRYVARHGARVPLMAGGAAVAAGVSAIAWSLARHSAGSLALPSAVFGLGAGLCSPSITNTIMGGLPAARAAVASSITSASRQLGQTLGIAITGTVLVAGVGGSLARGYAHAGPPAWWVTAAFGAAIIPLALATAHPSTPASQRRALPLLPAVPAALAGLALAGGPHPLGQAASRSRVMLARGWPFPWPRSGGQGRAAPPLAGPEPAPLHHDRRRAQPPGNAADGDSANGAAPPPDAPPLAGTGPAPLHHDKRRAQPPDNGTGGDGPDGAGSEPHIGADTYQVSESASTLGRAGPGLLPAAGNTGRELEAQAVAQALASLSPEHRRVIVETFYRGRSVKQTAAVLGIPPAIVKARTFEALKALKRALQERN